MFSSSNGYAHSGGTDSNGCHAGTELYHCHTPKGSGGSLTVLGAVLVGGVIAWLLLDKDEENSFSVDARNYIKHTGSTVEYGNYLAFPLAPNNNFSFQIGSQTTRENSWSNDLHNQNSQLFVGVGLRVKQGIHLNFRSSPKKVGINLGFNF